MRKYKSEILVIGSIILISIISFNLGKLKATKDIKQNLSIYEREGEVLEQQFKVYASINGTKYHFPWCSGAQTISDKNKIEFNNEEAAVLAGYTLAGNCSR